MDGLAAILAMVLLRYGRGWDQSGLARETGTSPSQVSAYHGGNAVPPPDFLRRAAEAADLPGYLFEPMLRAVRSFVAAARGRSRAGRVLSEGLAYELLGLLGDAVDLIGEPPGGREFVPVDPETVEDLWERLRRRSSAERRLLVEEGVEYQSRALSERVAAESRDLVAIRPTEARELGELAARMAELAEASSPHLAPEWAKLQ
ncbi:MAG TPA: helix-turn-helix transcriptional regulator [Thermoanaerobaculia bacterium]|nr:helix-turn-helix transcriptional regulator [Thermoanaerobaculia bacterium]